MSRNFRKDPLIECPTRVASQGPPGVLCYRGGAEASVSRGILGDPTGRVSLSTSSETIIVGMPEVLQKRWNCLSCTGSFERAHARVPYPSR